MPATRRVAASDDPGMPARVYRFPQQDTRSLRQRVVDALRASILEGHLQPGDRLRESDIAQQMGVSRGPVREALRELEHDGLVISEPYRETVVADITLQDVLEILIPIRRILETRAVRDAVTRITDDDLEELAGYVDAMRSAGARADLHQVVDLDVTFHQAIMRIAGQRTALHIWESVSHRIRTHFYRNDAHYADLSVVADEHVPLVEALRSRDALRVVEVLDQHLRDAATVTGAIQHRTDKDAS